MQLMQCKASFCLKRLESSVLSPPIAIFSLHEDPQDILKAHGHLLGRVGHAVQGKPLTEMPYIALWLVHKQAPEACFGKEPLPVEANWPGHDHRFLIHRVFVPCNSASAARYTLRLVHLSTCDHDLAVHMRPSDGLGASQVSTETTCKCHCW